MTYTVSGGTLNPTHSLTFAVIQWTCIITDVCQYIALQADICPLMASLIGVPIPLQSVVRNLSVCFHMTVYQY